MFTLIAVELFEVKKSVLISIKISLGVVMDCEKELRLLKRQETFRLASAKYRKKMILNSKNFKSRRCKQVKDCQRKTKLNVRDGDKTGFKNYRQLKYAVKSFERNLPEDPAKRKQLLTQLLFNANQEDSDETNEPEEDQEEETAAEPSPLQKSIIDFYHREDISRQMPGMKNFKSVKTSAGRERVQVQYLTLTIDEAYKIYKQENNKIVSKSTFSNLRPPYILPSTKTPHDVCSCKYHQNMELIFVALERFIIDDVIENLKDLTIKLVCSTDNFECMFGRCIECSKFKEGLSKMFLVSSLSIVVKLEQWENIGIPERVETQTALSEVISKFADNFDNYKQHSYVARIQNETLKDMKENVEESCAIIQTDFAENYNIVAQHEIQEAHFKKPQIALFTAAVTSKHFYQSYAIVSDETDHGKHTVWTFRKTLLDNLKKKLPNIKKIVDFTDGCAQQFKNGSTLSCLAFAAEDFGVSAEHHFMATSHGKGPHDGIGAIIKRRVKQEVLSKNTKVSNAKEFCEVARRVSDKIETLLVTKDEIERNKPMLNERWEKLIPWEGIRSCHFFRPDDRKTIQAATTSRLDGLRTYEMFQRGNAKKKAVKIKPPKYVKKSTEEKKQEAADKKKKVDDKKKNALARKTALMEKKTIADEKKKIAQEKKNASMEKKKVAQQRKNKKNE